MRLAARLLLDLDAIRRIGCGGVSHSLDCVNACRRRGQVCVQYGFCLSWTEAERLRQAPPPTIEAFADAVLVAEGLNPGTTDKQLRRTVRECVAKYLSDMDVNVDVDAAHEHSAKHRAKVEASNSCGCFYCLAIFPPREISHWVDDGATALCPRCGIDSVIGSESRLPITPDFLTLMNLRWLGR